MVLFFVICFVLHNYCDNSNCTVGPELVKRQNKKDKQDEQFFFEIVDEGGSIRHSLYTTC